MPLYMPVRSIFLEIAKKINTKMFNDSDSYVVENILFGEVWIIFMDKAHLFILSSPPIARMNYFYEISIFFSFRF